MSGTYARVGHEEHYPDVATQWHDLRLFFSDVRLHAEYGITRWLSVDLLWALRIVRVDFELQDAATRTKSEPPSGEDIHHRTETIVGLGDPWLSLRAVKQLDSWAVLLRAGATLPVGATVTNPFKLGREGMQHQHIQLGTGTVDPFAEVEVRKTLRAFTLSTWVIGKASLYENAHRYRAGSQLLGGIDVASSLWARRWMFTLGTLVYHEQPERWSGLVETEGNLGRTDLMIDTAVAWQFLAPWTLSLGARVPYWSKAAGAQLNTPAIGLLTLARTFDLRRR